MDTRPPAKDSGSQGDVPTGTGIANAEAGVTLGSVGEPQDLALFMSNAAGWEGPKASSRRLH